MTTIADALRGGDLDSALGLATAAVKASPTSADARWMMAELLLVQGDAERADRMLDAAALREPNPAVAEFRGLLRAEVQRLQVLREGRVPKFQSGGPTPAQTAAMRARVMLRSGELAAANEAAAEVESLRARVPGVLRTHQGQSIEFDDLRDTDDLMAAELEVLTVAGDHLLTPMERVQELAFDAPRRARDLVWRRCTISLKDGTQGVVYVPALYLGLQRETAPEFLLGRATDWTDPARGPVCGRGLRIWLAGDEALDLMAIDTVTFR